MELLKSPKSMTPSWINELKLINLFQGFPHEHGLQWKVIGVVMCLDSHSTRPPVLRSHLPAPPLSLMLLARLVRPLRAWDQHQPPS